MTKSRGADTNRTRPAPPRKPLWRRLNRHMWFILHVVVFLALGTWIWTLNASTVDKQFDSLLLLTILSAHGTILYRNQRIAFGLHLLMFSAGNGAIWATTAALNDKLTVTVGWVIGVIISGLWLARRQFTAQPVPSAAAPQRKSRGRKAAPAVADDTAWAEDAQADGDAWYEAPPDEPVTKGRGKKRKS